MPIFVYAFPVTLGAGIWLSLGTVLFEGSAIASLHPESSIFGWTDPFWIVWVGYLSLVLDSAGIRDSTLFCDGYPR